VRARAADLGAAAASVWLGRVARAGAVVLGCAAVGAMTVAATQLQAGAVVAAVAACAAAAASLGGSNALARHGARASGASR
jgi:hypothetical protein